MEHMTTFHFFLPPSPQGKERMKNSAERCFLEKREKRVDMKEEQTH